MKVTGKQCINNRLQAAGYRLQATDYRLLATGCRLEAERLKNLKTLKYF